MKSILLVVAAVVLGAAAPASAAITLTFDDVENNPCCVQRSTYTAGGMVFGNPDSPSALFFPPDVNPYGFTNIDPVGTSVVTSGSRLRVDGGGTFDLLGFTFGLRAEADFGSTPATGYYEVRFVYDDGRDEVERFDVHRFGPEVVTLSRTALRRVEFLTGRVSYDTATCSFCTHTGTSIGSMALDNIVVDNVVQSPDPQPAAIPEPSTWALMIGGFGLAGATLRRRHLRGLCR